MKELLFTDRQQPSFVGLVVKELLFTDQWGACFFASRCFEWGVIPAAYSC